MTHVRTAWRLTDPPPERTCRIEQHHDGQARVVVLAHDGRRLDTVELRGLPDETLHQAWLSAAALYRKYRGSAPSDGTDYPRSRPIRSGRSSREPSDIGHHLRHAIRRVDDARQSVARCLKSLEEHGEPMLVAVRHFRQWWEVLDLEYHLLTGEPLTAGRFQTLRTHIDPSGRKTEPVVTEAVRRPAVDADRPAGPR